MTAQFKVNQKTKQKNLKILKANQKIKVKVNRNRKVKNS